MNTTRMAAAMDTLEPSAPETVRRFLETLREGSFDHLEDLFAPDIWVRNLLTREIHESATADAAVQAFRKWLETPYGSRMIDAGSHTMAGREFIRYRFLLRPRWAPTEWRVIEQAGFCRVKAGRMTRLDLACTGYFPVEEYDALPVDVTGPGDRHEL